LTKFLIRCRTRDWSSNLDSITTRRP